MSQRPRLLLLSYRFAPETYPLSIGLKGVVEELSNEWDIDVVTAAENAYSPPGTTVHHVPPRSTERIMKIPKRLRLEKLTDFFTWPDPFWPWILPAFRTAKRVIRDRQPDAILVFMMPFSTGMVGTLLKVQTGLPLIINLNDSLTCSDMRPSYPSRLHHALYRRLEDYYVRTADRSVYVSRHNRDRIRDRQPDAHREKIKLVRCSAEPHEQVAHRHDPDDVFKIVYTGAMSGWYNLDPAPSSLAKRAYQAWMRLGRHIRTPLDYRSHSPVFVGQAVRRVLETHPEWADRIRIDVYGDTYPKDVVDRVLKSYQIEDLVTLHGRIPPSEVPGRTQEADLLFLTLPDRTDGTPGGRISLKTYEYLMTDRPILAAVPPGENRDFLQDKPGTYVTDPFDAVEMATVIETLATEHFNNQSQPIDRPGLQDAFSHKTRAQSLSQILKEAIDSKSHAKPVFAAD
jgi:glycosyltransferase involved in cell wall biosynthesis